MNRASPRATLTVGLVLACVGGCGRDHGPQVHPMELTVTTPAWSFDRAFVVEIVGPVAAVTAVPGFQVLTRSEGSSTFVIVIADAVLDTRLRDAPVATVLVEDRSADTTYELHLVQVADGAYRLRGPDALSAYQLALRPVPDAAAGD